MVRFIPFPYPIIKPGDNNCALIFHTFPRRFGNVIIFSPVWVLSSQSPLLPTRQRTPQTAFRVPCNSLFLVCLLFERRWWEFYRAVAPRSERIKNYILSDARRRLQQSSLKCVRWRRHCFACSWWWLYDCLYYSLFFVRERRITNNELDNYIERWILRYTDYDAVYKRHPGWLTVPLWQTIVTIC